MITLAAVTKINKERGTVSYPRDSLASCTICHITQISRPSPNQSYARHSKTLDTLKRYGILTQTHRTLETDGQMDG